MLLTFTSVLWLVYGASLIKQSQNASISYSKNKNCATKRIIALDSRFETFLSALLSILNEERYIAQHAYVTSIVWRDESNNMRIFSYAKWAIAQ